MVLKPVQKATPVAPYPGGKVSGRSFGVSVGRAARVNLTTLEAMPEDVHARLAGVVIEGLDYGDFIARHDSPGTLFYLDPPYRGREDDYGKAMFSARDFARLAAQLAGIRGRFVMSLGDVPEVRELFARFEIEAVETSYTVGKKAGSRGKRGELLVSGPRANSVFVA